MVEWVLEIPEVFPDHLLTEAFPGDQEMGHLRGSFPDKSLLTQENDALLRLSVKTRDSLVTVLHVLGFVY